MLERIINDPELARYRVSYRPSQTLFMEGDVSADLFVLISGELDVFKGKTAINYIGQPGELFGEMSFLLGTRRTATVKARGEVEALRIPSEQVESLMSSFPELAQAVTLVLARRLDEASHLVHGLREFSDELPDAMMITDQKDRVLSMNRAARDLYGRELTDVLHQPAGGLFQDPEQYTKLCMEAKERGVLQERVLTLTHPAKGLRYLSLSLTALYDGHRNFQGMVSLARDVTGMHKLKRKYRNAVYWLAVPLVLLALLAGFTYWGYPYFIKGHQTSTLQRHELRAMLAKDYMLLSSLLAGPLQSGQVPAMRKEMKKFFTVQDSTASPYTGLVLLGPDKRVLAAYSPRLGDAAQLAAGTSYARLNFESNKRSIQKVVSLWRLDPDHPGSYRTVEVVFPLLKDGEVVAWLSFQLDPKKLKKEYGLSEEDLVRFTFKEP